MSKINSVAIYCGSSPGTDPEYISKAKQLGKYLGLNQITMVYGGGNIGLMGATADACLEVDGKVIGVCPTFLLDREVGHHEVTELIVVEHMHDRKIKMFDLSDAFIILPGGIGTLDEFFEVLTWKQLNQHNKEIIIYNMNQFYNPMFQMIEHMISNGFLKAENKNLYISIESLEDLIKILNK